jgi:hypothetical protein
MLAILPLCLLLFLYVIFTQKDSCWRRSLLSAFLAWGVMLSIITELLSLGKLLTFDWLVWIWLSIDFIAAYICFVSIKKSNPIFNQKDILNQSSFSIFLLCGIAFIIGIVGVVAWSSPPNNWDSMVYHMPRVVHWQQNHSLTYYPVNVLRQLYQSPWAEFAILHLQILSGGDRLANFVQWFGMVGSIVGVSLIAKQIGANVRGQIFAAVVCATIPMGILQGSSTKNDYVVSLWLVCFAYYTLLMINSRLSLIHSIAIGASLGLAISTKGTAYIYALPFCLWLPIALAKHKLRQLSNHVLVISSLVILLNICHSIRNFNLFGSLIAVGEEKYSNDFFGISVFLSNIIRNISLHLLVPSWSQPFSTSIAKAVEQVIGIIHLGLGLDVSNPQTTWVGTKFAVTSFENLLHEDYTSNFIHLLLIISTIIVVLMTKRIGRQKQQIVYLAIVGSTFLLFCFLLKWQPWHSRLHLPLFVLLSAFVGTVLSDITYNKLVNFILIILILSSIPWLVSNQTRSLTSQNNILNTSRIDGYFNVNSILRKPYIDAAKFIKSQGCTEVGLSIGGNDWEYPFWVLLDRDKKESVRIEHVDVTNISNKASHSIKKFTPCAIIYTNTTDLQNKVSSDGNYSRKWFADPVSVSILTRKQP